MFEELSKPDFSKMIWIFLSEDNKVIIPFQGSEQEALEHHYSGRNYTGQGY